VIIIQHAADDAAAGIEIGKEREVCMDKSEFMPTEIEPTPPNQD